MQRHASKYTQLVDPINIKVSSSTIGLNTDPDVFGPPFWFVLHNAAATYPINPTPYVRNGMKQILINLPLMVPCTRCKEHFYNFVKNSNIDDAVSSKEKLFSFFVTVHNYVNKRYGKREMSVGEAKLLYGFDSPTMMRITYS